MRAHKTASAVFATAVAGSLALGVFTTATASSAEHRTEAVRQAPLPDSQQVDRQAQLLDTTGAALQPVADVLRDVLKDPLSRAEAARHSKAVREAVAPFTRPASRQYAPNQHASERRPAATPLTAKAAADLTKQVDALVRASVMGEQKRVGDKAERTVTAAVNLLSSIVVSGQLPAADLEGLPQMPRTPQAQPLPERMDAQVREELREPALPQQYQWRR